MDIEIDATKESDPVVDVGDRNYKILVGGLSLSLTHDQLEAIKEDIEEILYQGI